MQEIMNISEIIKVDYTNDTPAISARELHEFLAVETPYHKWFPRMCEYGFTENQDYSVTDIFVHNPAGGPQHQKDAILTIDMAKEICMIQRSEKGKLARQYFIQLEKDWNSPEKVMARALRIANRTIDDLKTQNAVLQPKAEYFDCLVERNTLTSFRETAKELGVPPKKFVQFLVDGKYLYRDGKGKLMPYEEKNDGLFKVKECRNEKNQWSGVQTLVTPRGRETFRLLYR
ncbi:phage antirepressor KilAC domain-containing protein [uncultured Dysosmobacter sp.]|uniref:phage antirepressor KilAC domain-containing protein n=1 Tax=uncultured Dysosmobacter sp. TaxID=2591384 RepID=UPI002638C41C|nr:antA/AntB antirepressor family protein [uncultured Dysosmobacter sp.]